MSSFDPTAVRKAIAEFTPSRPQKFQDLLPARDVVVVDCRAASPDLFLEHFAEIDLAAVLSALNASLTLVMPVNHESDSVDQVQRLADQVATRSAYVVVRNAARSDGGG